MSHAAKYFEHIAVLGSGGVGGYFGALLARAGHHVTFIARGAQLAALRAHGLQVRSTLGDFAIVPADVAAAADPPYGCDLVLVAVKNYDLAGAIPTLAAMLGPQTTVVSLLNGVEAPALLAAELPQLNLLIGQCGIGAWVEQPGTIVQQGGRRTITLAAWSAGSAELHALADLFRAVGVSVAVGEDALAAMWHKLVWTASFGGVAALTGKTAHELRGTPYLRRALQEAMLEALRVARGLGVAAPAQIASEWLDVLDTISPTAMPSLLRDRRAGRQLEVDALSGAIVRGGIKAEIVTPLHGLLWAALGTSAVP